MVSLLIAYAHSIWLVSASFIAGVMNAMAGGGSFVSFPAMLAMGVAPIQANATNTVALWPGQLTSVAALRSDLRKDLLPVVLISSVLGGVSGAVVLLNTRQLTFLHMVPWLLLVASLLFGISGPVSRSLNRRAIAKAAAESREHLSQATPPLIPLFLVLLPVCFYIGYFGAGAGFLIMSALALFGVEEMKLPQLAESSRRMPVKPLRRHHLHRQRCGHLALLPRLDDLLRRRRLSRRTVRAPHQTRYPPPDRRRHRLHHGRILLLEAGMSTKPGTALIASPPEIGLGTGSPQ